MMEMASALAVFVLALIAIAPGADALEWVQIARAQTDVVGAPDGTRFKNLRALGVTDDGTVVIRGDTARFIVLGGLGGYLYEAGLWSWNSRDGLQRFATQLPSIYDEEGDERMRLSSDGRVAVAVPTGFVNSTIDTLFVCRVGYVTCDTIAQTGDPVPGRPGSTLREFTSVDLDPNGGLAFGASFNIQGGSWGGGVIAVGDDGTQTLIASAGDPLDGVAPGATLAPPFMEVRSRAGAVVFTSAIERPGQLPFDPPFDFVYEIALSRWKEGEPVRAVVAAGAPVSGASLEATFAPPLGTIYDDQKSLLKFALNEGGDLAAVASATTPVEGEYLRGLWLCERNEICDLRVAVGDPVPGMDGWVFQVDSSENSFLSPYVAADRGIAFMSAIAGSSSPDADAASGIFTTNPDGAGATRVLPGDTAPGLGGDQLSGGFGIATYTDAGHMVFCAQLERGSWSGWTACFSSDPGSPLRLLVRDGDLAQLEPGSGLEPIEIHSLVLDRSASRAVLGAARAGDSAESALFVATIPEPSCALSAIAAFAALAAHRRRT